MSGSNLEVRAYRPGDERAILALHARAYAGHPERTLAHWRWRYTDNPLRSTEVAVAMDGAGKCLAVAAGIPLRVLCNGQELRARLGGDSAVDPEMRGGLAGGRAIRSTVLKLYEAYPCAIDWGYPEPAIQRLGIRYLDWNILRDVTFFVREANAPKPAFPSDLSVEKVERFGADVDDLWAKCRDDWRTATVRDAAYLNWRYADHPNIDYQLLEAREGGGGALRGIAVLRAGGWSDEAMSLFEWMAPAGDDGAEAALIAQFIEEARRGGKPWTCTWLAGSQGLVHRIQRAYGFFAQPSPYQATYRYENAEFGRRWFHEHWTQTMGDIDFF